MRRVTQRLSSVLGMFVLFILCLSSPLPATAAVPGIKLYDEGLGVTTWTSNVSNPFTALDHWILVVDHDATSFNGGDYTVTVTGPNGYNGTLYFSSVNNTTSGYYELFDTSINQNNLSQYSGTYTYTVTRNSDGSFSEASDELLVNRVLPVDEASFYPRFSSPQQSILAYFDDVYVNNVLFDNFDSGFDGAKWNPLPNGVTVQDGKTSFNITWGPASPSSVTMSMKSSPSTVNEFKAKVKVQSIQGDYTYARIGGGYALFQGKVIEPKVGIRGSEAVCFISLEGLEGIHHISQELLPITPLGPVTLGKTYDLILDWDEPTATITFKVVGLEDSVSYERTFVIPGAIEANPSQTRFLSASNWFFFDTTAPEFDWAPVEGASHYRVRIYNSANNSTIFRGYTASPPYKLPPGILKPNGYYKYRIEALRDHQWFEWDNVSVTDRDKGKFIIRAETPQAPYVDLASIGVETWSTGIFPPHVSFYVKVYDAQGVPQNIYSVKAFVPGGDEVNLQFDVNEGVNCGLYRGDYLGAQPLPSGVYFITATDKDGNTHTASDTLNPSPIDLAAESSLVPVDNIVIGGTGVDFDWEDVPGAVQYELMIYDKNLTRITTLRSTLSQASLPPGILKENFYYRYRVLAYKEFFEDIVSNGSNSPAGSLYDMHSFFTKGRDASTQPSISLGKFGVAIWRGPHPVSGSIYNLEYSALISQPEGIPETIRSVDVTYPDGVTKKSLKFDNRESTWGFNYFEDETYTSTASIQPGIYSFTVTDFLGNTSLPVTDELTAEDIAAASGFGWPTITAPLDFSVLGSTNPTIEWTTFSEASYYQVRILGGYSAASELYISPEITGTSYTLPTGILQPNRTYRVRVYAFKESIGAAPEVDLYSGSSTMSQTDLHLIVPDTVTGPNIVVTPIDQNTGALPATISFDQVNSSGTTTLASSSSGTLPPSGFALGYPPVYYEIETTAGYSGNVQVCFNYSGTYYENESELKLYHYEDPAWMDRTSSLDTGTKIICGNVTTLSPFALFEPKYCKGDLDTDGDGDGLDLHALIISFAGASAEGDLNGDGQVNNTDLVIFLNNFGHNDCAGTP